MLLLQQPCTEGPLVRGHNRVVIGFGVQKVE
jgi:hypothetical protein